MTAPLQCQAKGVMKPSVGLPSADATSVHSVQMPQVSIETSRGNFPPSRLHFLDEITEGLKKIPLQDKSVVISRVLEFSSADGLELAKRVGLKGDNLLDALIQGNVIAKHPKLIEKLLSTYFPTTQKRPQDRRGAEQRFNKLQQNADDFQRGSMRQHDTAEQFKLRCGHTRSHQLLDRVDGFYAYLLKGRRLEPGLLKRVSLTGASLAYALFQRMLCAYDQVCSSDITTAILCRQLAKQFPHEFGTAAALTYCAEPELQAAFNDSTSFLKALSSFSPKVSIAAHHRSGVLNYFFLQRGNHALVQQLMHAHISIPTLVENLNQAGIALAEENIKRLKDETKLLDILYLAEKAEIARILKSELCASASARYSLYGRLQVSRNQIGGNHYIEDRGWIDYKPRTTKVREDLSLRFSISNNHCFEIISRGIVNDTEAVVIFRDDLLCSGKAAFSSYERGIFLGSLSFLDNERFIALKTRLGSPRIIEGVLNDFGRRGKGGVDFEWLTPLPHNTHLIFEHSRYPVCATRVTNGNVMIGIGDSDLVYSPDYISVIGSLAHGADGESLHAVRLSSGQCAVWRFDGRKFETVFSHDCITALIESCGKPRIECLNSSRQLREYYEETLTGEIRLVREVDAEVRLTGNSVLQPASTDACVQRLRIERGGFLEGFARAPATVFEQGPLRAIILHGYKQDTIFVDNFLVQHSSANAPKIDGVYIMGSALAATYIPLARLQGRLALRNQITSAYHKAEYPFAVEARSLLVYCNGKWSDWQDDYRVYALKLDSGETIVFANDLKNNESLLMRHMDGELKITRTRQADYIPIKWLEHKGSVYLKCMRADGSTVCMRIQPKGDRIEGREQVLDFTVHHGNMVWLDKNCVRMSGSKKALIEGLVDPVLRQSRNSIVVESSENGQKKIQFLPRSPDIQPSSDERIKLSILDVLESPSPERLRQVMGQIKQSGLWPDTDLNVRASTDQESAVINELFDADPSLMLTHLSVDKDRMSAAFIAQLRSLLYHEECQNIAQRRSTGLLSRILELIGGIGSVLHKRIGLHKAENAALYATSEEIQSRLQPHERWKTTGGDPRLTGRTLITSRRPLNHFFVDGVYGEYRQGEWQQVQFTLPQSASHAARDEHTFAIRTHAQPATITLPVLLGGTIIKDRIKGVKQDGTEIFLEACDAAVGVTVNVPAGITSVLFSISAPALTIPMQDVSNEAYDAFKTHFESRNGLGLSLPLVPIRAEWRMFLDGIKELAPFERVQRIVQYAQRVLYYDYDFHEWMEEANAAPLPEMIDLMRARMMMLRQKSKGTALELGDKEYAGVCAHIAAFTTAALLREAHIPSGIMTGYVIKGDSVKTSDAHAMPYVIWPCAGESFDIIPLDVIPTSNSAQVQELLEHLRVQEVSPQATADSPQSNIAPHSRKSGQQVMSERAQTVEAACNGTLEDLVNEIQRANWPLTEIHWCRKVFEAACFSGIGVFTAENFSIQHADEFAALLRGNRSWHDTRCCFNDSDEVPGTELFDLILHQEAYISKIVGSSRAALKLMDEIIRNAQHTMPASMARAAELIIRYLRADKMQTQ